MIAEVEIEKLEVDDDLRVHWQSGESSHFSFIWLRDNARDEASFDARSHQRRVFTAGLDPEIRPESTRLDAEGVRIKWPDMDGEVAYSAGFLHQYRGDQFASPADLQTWAAGFQAPRIDFGALGKSDNMLLESIRRYGVSVIAECPRDSSSVEVIAAELGYVRQTIFGGVWSLEADAAMDDSAYSTEALRPHTDGTFSFDPPGVQILLCLEKEGEGAESILVDGFHVAEQVRSDKLEVFDDLCRIPITGIYRGDGEFLRAEHPVFRVRHGQVYQVCFNNYDRDVMQLSDDEMRRMYRGIRVVDRLFNDPVNQWRYTLSAGEAIVFDNWRILHGRSDYTGKRKMAGTYVNREDLESRFITRMSDD